MTISRIWTCADMVGVGDRVDLTEGFTHVLATVRRAWTEHGQRYLVVDTDDGRAVTVGAPVLSTICTIHI